MVQAVVTVRGFEFCGFWGCFSVWKDPGKGRGLVDYYRWCREGFLSILPGIPMFWDVSPVRACTF